MLIYNNIVDLQGPVTREEQSDIMHHLLTLSPEELQSELEFMEYLQDK